MNFRAFLLILGVFLSVLSHRSCSVEDPEADSGPNPSSNEQNNPQDEKEGNEVKSNKDLSDISASTASLPATQSTSSLSSSSSLITDTESESIATSSSEKTISLSELEQLVLPTIAPATPHFDSESSITSTLSVIVSVTEAINQEKKPVEDEKQQHDSVSHDIVSNIESEKKEIEIDKEKGKESEKLEIQSVEDKPIEGDIQDEIPEKPQEDQSQELTAEAQAEKKDVDGSSSASVFKDDKDETKDEIKELKDKENETKKKEDKPKEREDDSITAELKQAEEETKPASEEMPSFDEFKRQHLQEEEKQKNILKQQKEVKIGPETLSKPTRKIKERKQNNYASLDCGAKILKANAEASNIFSILQDNRDLYMLNPCSAKIWFIVELCDNVQVKTIEIANFELFSSTPESFKVYVSGRYPTREWTLLGTFQARDERNLQSFPLDEPIYAKYIKVEMLSHFGSEHYCPLSLFRVFGISMMEELEDHEAGGQDDSDAVDHDDDVAQVLPSDPSVKEEDKTTKSTTNILATVGDTLFNIVKVAAKKLTGVIDSEKNLTSDKLGVSTVAPSSGIVSSVTQNGKDAKPSIVTLIPSDDEDDKIHGRKHDNVTNNATNFTNTKTREGLEETGQENTTFFNKIDSDSSSGPATSSATFTSCELLVRMLGHSGFGCMMGNVLYSKRKNGGFTPREDTPKKHKTKAPPSSDGKPETTTEKGKEDSKKNEEKKEKEEESGKVEKKGKKNGKGKVKNGNKETTVEKEDNKISSKSVNELNDKGSSIDTKKSSDVNTREASIDNVQTSINGSTDPVSMVQPSEMQPPIMKPCDPTSDDKGTPVLSSVSVLTTQPSSHTRQSKTSQATDNNFEPTLNQVEKSKEKSTETETRTAEVDTPNIKPDKKDEVDEGEHITKDDVKSTTSKKENSRSSTDSTVEQSDMRDTCASVDSSDNLLIKPSQSTAPSECKAPSATGSKDVDVLEFKILDSAGREGTAHLETLDKPDKPVKPDEPVSGEEPIKEWKEKDKINQSESTSVSDSGTSTVDESDKDESVVSSSSSVEPSKPSVTVPEATTEPPEPEQPTTAPDINAGGQSESISPLSPPPVDVPVVPPSSTIEASLTDDISSVLSKVPNSAGVGGQGLASSGTQKESIFMRLTNRIKALEQNLTLSTLYMEKLNQKYRKIVEEMQKNFDKKVNLLTNATRKAEAVIKHQKEQISNLQDNTDKTSRDMKQFNKKLESLNIQVMERHIIGLFLEVILIMILFVVFRRWDRARIRREILRESQMNGTILNSYDYSTPTESNALGKILYGHLSGREQLQRSFANPNEPESIGTFGSAESVTQTQKEEFSPLLDAKKKRNRKRPKSVILTSETSPPTTVSEQTNQPSPNSLVSVTAGLLFSPARGLLNGFKRSQSLDDCQINQKMSLPSTSRLKKTKSMNIIPENSEQMAASFSITNTKKGSRIPTPPPPPPTQKYWTAGSTDGLYQKPGQQASSLKLTQKKGRGLNGANPYT